MKKITLCVSCVLLSGCFGDNDIQTLKEMVFPGSKSSMALGVALDQRDMCQTTSWNMQKKDSNVINYTCELTDFASMFETFRAQLVKKETKELTKRIGEAKEVTEGIDSGIENLEKIKTLIQELIAKGLVDKYRAGAKALNIDPDYEFIIDDTKGYVFRQNRKHDLQNDYIQTQKDIKAMADKYEIEPITLRTIFISLSSILGDKEKEVEVTNYLEDLHKELKSKQNDNLDLIKELKTKSTDIKKSISLVHKDAIPKKIVQLVNFVKTKDNFALQDCTFKLTLENNDEVVLTSEACLPMSHKKTYTDEYKGLFGKYYGEKLSNYKEVNLEIPKQSTMPMEKETKSQ